MPFGAGPIDPQTKAVGSRASRIFDLCVRFGAVSVRSVSILMPGVIIFGAGDAESA